MTIENPFQKSYDALSTEEQREIDDTNSRELQSLKFLFTPFSADQSKSNTLFVIGCSLTDTIVLGNISNLFSTAAMPFSGVGSHLMEQYQQQPVSAPSTRNPFIS